MTDTGNDQNVTEEVISLPESYLGLEYHNNSHYFLTPLFGVNYVLKNKNYVNSYIEDAGRKSVIECPLYCLFKFKTFEEANKTNTYFEAHPNFGFSYYAGRNNDDNLIMYTLILKNEAEIKDYKHIVNGRYSFTSESYKEKCKKFGFFKSTLEFVEGVTTKSPKFKENMEEYLNVKLDNKAELWNIFEPKREVFRYA